MQCSYSRQRNTPHYGTSCMAYIVLPALMICCSQAITDSHALTQMMMKELMERLLILLILRTSAAANSGLHTGRCPSSPAATCLICGQKCCLLWPHHSHLHLQHSAAAGGAALYGCEGLAKQQHQWQHQLPPPMHKREPERHIQTHTNTTTKHTHTHQVGVAAACASH